MPPKHLVVTGFYRYVRNPMCVAVTALIIGQALLFGSLAALEYGAIVWAVFFLFVLGYEEPTLGEPVSRGVQALPRECETVDSAHHTVARGSLSCAPMVRTRCFGRTLRMRHSTTAVAKHCVRHAHRAGSIRITYRVIAPAPVRIFSASVAPTSRRGNPSAAPEALP